MVIHARSHTRTHRISITSDNVNELILPWGSNLVTDNELDNVLMTVIVVIVC